MPKRILSTLSVNVDAPQEGTLFRVVSSVNMGHSQIVTLEEVEAAQPSAQADEAYWSCKCGVSNNAIEFNWCYVCGSPRR